MYHSIDESGSFLSTSPGVFRRQMRSLFDRGIAVAAPDRLLQPGVADPGYPAVALTFDDGFDNFYTAALPVLSELRLKSTLLVVPGRCGGSGDWFGQPATLADRRLLCWSRIEELHRAGVELGAHSMTHPSLTRLPFSRARAEVLESKKRIEDRVGVGVKSFAYPYGAESEPLRELVSEAFRVGLSARLGYVTGQSRRESLERIDAYYIRRLFWFRRLFRSSGDVYLRARGVLRNVKAVVRDPLLDWAA